MTAHRVLWISTRFDRASARGNKVTWAPYGKGFIDTVGLDLESTKTGVCQYPVRIRNVWSVVLGTKLVIRRSRWMTWTVVCWLLTCEYGENSGGHRAQ